MKILKNSTYDQMISRICQLREENIAFAEDKKRMEFSLSECSEALNKTEALVQEWSRSQQKYHHKQSFLNNVIYGLQKSIYETIVVKRRLRMAIVGPPDSGKTSFVKHKLLPVLKSVCIIEEGHAYQTHAFSNVVPKTVNKENDIENEKLRLLNLVKSNAGKVLVIDDYDQIHECVSLISEKEVEAGLVIIANSYKTIENMHFDLIFNFGCKSDDINHEMLVKTILIECRKSSVPEYEHPIYEIKDDPGFYNLKDPLGQDHQEDITSEHEGQAYWEPAKINTNAEWPTNSQYEKNSKVKDHMDKLIEILTNMGPGLERQYAIQKLKEASFWLDEHDKKQSLK